MRIAHLMYNAIPGTFQIDYILFCSIVCLVCAKTSEAKNFSVRELDKDLY